MQLRYTDYILYIVARLLVTILRQPFHPKEEILFFEWPKTNQFTLLYSDDDRITTYGKL